MYIYIYKLQAFAQLAATRALAGPLGLGLGLDQIFVYIEAFVHESLLLFTNTSFVWAPPPPCIAHTSAHYVVPP